LVEVGDVGVVLVLALLFVWFPLFTVFALGGCVVEEGYTCCDNA